MKLCPETLQWSKYKKVQVVNLLIMKLMLNFQGFFWDKKAP